MTAEEAQELIEWLKSAADKMDPISYNGMYHSRDVNRIVLEFAKALQIRRQKHEYFFKNRKDNLSKLTVI